jgi:hypothetical protein
MKADKTMTGEGRLWHMRLGCRERISEKNFESLEVFNFIAFSFVFRSLIFIAQGETGVNDWACLLTVIRSLHPVGGMSCLLRLSFISKRGFFMQSTISGNT